MSQPWLRLYRAALNNPKIQRLGFDGVGFWVNCLMASDDDGLLPETTDLAWAMRASADNCANYLLRLDAAGLIHAEDGRWRLHDWAEHQRKSDTDPTARDRKRRQRDRERGVTRDVTEKSRVQIQSREELEQIQIRESEPGLEVSGLSKAKPARGTRWPPDQIVSQEWVEQGAGYREAAKLPVIDLRLEAERFQNYWSSKSGAGATKMDWRRTWLNWTINAKGVSGNGTGQHGRRRAYNPITKARERLAELGKTWEGAGEED